MEIKAILFILLFFIIVMIFNAISLSKEKKFLEKTLNKIDEEIIFKTEELHCTEWIQGFDLKNYIFNYCKIYATKDFIIINGYSKIGSFKYTNLSVLLSQKKMPLEARKFNYIIKSFELKYDNSNLHCILNHNHVRKQSVNFRIHGFELSEEQNLINFLFTHVNKNYYN